MMRETQYTYDAHGNMLRMLNISDNEKVFVRMEGGTVRYQYDNHLGSACLELDEYGYIISYEEYHPFGTTSYRAGRSATEVSWKRYKYCGKERDEETGLYYYGARYYASWLGRFVSVDPLKEKYPSISSYVYCADNPIKYIDPTGMWIDDYFNTKGQYIGSTPEGNAVMITTASSIKDVNSSNSQLVSSYLKTTILSFKDFQKIQEKIVTAKSIANYYGEKANVRGEVGIGFHINEQSPAYTKEREQVNINANYHDFTIFDNAKNIENMLYHEYLHQVDTKPSTFGSHAGIYLKQILDMTFSETTEKFQKGIIISFAQFSMNAISNNEKGSFDRIDKFNKDNNLGYKLQINQYKNGKIKDAYLYKDNKPLITITL